MTQKDLGVLILKQSKAWSFASVLPILVALEVYQLLWGHFICKMGWSHLVKIH